MSSSNAKTSAGYRVRLQGITYLSRSTPGSDRWHFLLPVPNARPRHAPAVWISPVRVASDQAACPYQPATVRTRSPRMSTAIRLAAISAGHQSSLGRGAARTPRDFEVELRHSCPETESDKYPGGSVQHC